MEESHTSKKNGWLYVFNRLLRKWPFHTKTLHLGVILIHAAVRCPEKEPTSPSNVSSHFDASCGVAKSRGGSFWGIIRLTGICNMKTLGPCFSSPNYRISCVLPN